MANEFLGEEDENICKFYKVGEIQHLNYLS